MPVITTSPYFAVPAPLFIRLLGDFGSDSDRGYNITANGNSIYVTGLTVSAGAGSNDVFIAKYNSSGAIQWQRTLGSVNSEQGRGIAVDGNGDVCVVGISSDAIIAKYNSSGVIQWQRSLSGGGALDNFFGVTTDSNDNIYACGYTANGTIGGTYDGLIAKYNSSGAIQWQRQLGQSGSDYFYDIIADNNDDICIAGYANIPAGGNNTCIVAKYNSSGVIQWQRALGGANSEVYWGISVDGSDNIYVTGETNDPGDVRAIIAKYNSSGVIQWQRTLGSSGEDTGYKIAVDNDGNSYIIGYTSSDGAGSQDILIAKYNSSGAIQWQRTLGAGSNDLSLGGITITGSSLYITGYSLYNGLANWDAVIAKLPSDGSSTGTYGSFIYQSSSLTSSTLSLTDSAGSLTDQSISLTDSAGSLTDAAGTLTETIIA